ncbi:hypothetical protein ANO14919_089980 [Xylariales sp. No.14919]|nr:hypothetical protein ANO14919_089980 [Xylariales sp. No.14919]
MVLTYSFTRRGLGDLGRAESHSWLAQGSSRGLSYRARVPYRIAHNPLARSRSQTFSHIATAHRRSHPQSYRDRIAGRKSPRPHRSVVSVALRRPKSYGWSNIESHLRPHLRTPIESSVASVRVPSHHRIPHLAGRVDSHIDLDESYQVSYFSPPCVEADGVQVSVEGDWGPVTRPRLPRPPKPFRDAYAPTDKTVADPPGLLDMIRRSHGDSASNAGRPNKA